jgi:hypothetical protein
MFRIYFLQTQEKPLVIGQKFELGLTLTTEFAKAVRLRDMDNDIAAPLFTLLEKSNASLVHAKSFMEAAGSAPAELLRDIPETFFMVSVSPQNKEALLENLQKDPGLSGAIQQVIRL